MKLWIVTAVDYGETCDGKARVLSVCNTEDEAKTYVKADIEKWADEHAEYDIEIDFDKMNAYIPSWGYGVDTGCDWNIEEVEVSWLSE